MIEAPRPASAPAPRAGPARSTATRAPTYHSRPTLTTYWCRTHLASLVSLRSGMQVCEADATIRMATRVDTMVSGGMCVCEDAAARCPPKGTSCGDPITAPGTSPNYYRVATNGSLSPDPCRDVNRTTPCYDWCAQECEDDPLCSVWDFHDKGGGQCDLYNHTRMLREEDGRPKTTPLNQGYKHLEVVELLCAAGALPGGGEGASLVRITRNGSVQVGRASRPPALATGSSVNIGSLHFGAAVSGQAGTEGAAESSDETAAIVPRAAMRERAHHTSLVKRRKGRRLSVHHDTAHEHVIEGWLMKKSKSNAWQLRYFTTRSHYLMYSKKQGGELLGGVDLAGAGSSIDAVNLVTAAGGELATLRLRGLDSDAHGGTHGFGADAHGVIRTMELCWDRKLESKRAAGGKRNPTLAEWHSTLVRAAVAMREEAGSAPPTPPGVRAEVAALL